MGYIGDSANEEVLKSYEGIKEKYEQIINLSDKYYDIVIVDLDKGIGEKNVKDILKATDVIVAMTSQKAKPIQRIQKIIDQREILREENTVLTIGRYMDETKYNAKNITRSLLRKKDLINVIPYNNLFFEASQEGRVIDIFFDFMKIKEKDANYKYVQGLSELYDTIQGKIQMLQMNRRI